MALVGVADQLTEKLAGGVESLIGRPDSSELGRADILLRKNLTPDPHVPGCCGSRVRAMAP